MDFSKHVHPHAIFDDLFAGVIFLEPEETKEVSIFLFHNKAVKHLLDVSSYSYQLPSELQ